MESDNKKPLEGTVNPFGLNEEVILKDLKITGCPVCNRMEEIVFDFLAKWQYALARDENVQQEYAAERGFCAAHTWQLAQMASSSGLSRGYPKLLVHIAEKMLQLNGTFPEIKSGIAFILKDADSCRVCQLLKETERVYATHLSVFLEKEEVRAAYARSHGVCLRHLSVLVSFPISMELTRFLLSEAATKLREVAENMQCYALKHDALQKHLISKDERYAYLRALVYVAGARNVYAPHIGRV